MIYATYIAVLFSQKQHVGYLSVAKLFNIYCNTKLHMLDGILVTYACNHFSEMHFMQLSLYKKINLTFFEGTEREKEAENEPRWTEGSCLTILFDGPAWNESCH